MPRLAISNLAWSGNDHEIFSRLVDLGVDGLEVAPGKVASWDDLTPAAMEAFSSCVSNYGLEVCSFQAFLFGRPDLQLFGDPDRFEALCLHVERVCHLASIAGARILVFGAPKNRLLLGHSMKHAYNLAIERLSRLAEIAEKNSVALGMEAVPSAYGSEFVNSYLESYALVKEINSPGLVFHLDAGCTFVQGEDIGLAIKETADSLAHFHISQPNLADFSNPESYHFLAAQALTESGYDHWLCIEMLETANMHLAVTEAVSFVRKVYLNGGVP